MMDPNSGNEDNPDDDDNDQVEFSVKCELSKLLQNCSPTRVIVTLPFMVWQLFGGIAIATVWSLRDLKTFAMKAGEHQVKI